MMTVGVTATADVPTLVAAALDLADPATAATAQRERFVSGRSSASSCSSSTERITFAGLACSECRRRPRENAADEWRVYSDGVGGLHVFCPECAAREFGPGGPYEQLRGELAERLDHDARPL